MASPRALRDVTAGGARVRFVEAGDGPPLVLIHGYLSSRLVWEDVLPGLASRFRVIVPDLPGFGDSEKPPPARYPYGFGAFAESLVDVIAALGLGRVSVCGHGMGGGVALTLAARHPAMVDRLMVVDPIVYPHEAHMLAKIANVPVVGPILFKQLCGRTMFNRHFKETVYGPESKIPWTRVDHLYHLFNVPAAREAACATTRAIGDTRPLVALLPRVTATTLVMWGRGDRAVPVAHGRRLARELQHARFEVFECGHSPPEECPDAFVGVACAFLGKAGGRAA
jgi:pimeloyl-ACP methyl ester carboxylesterase